MTQPYDLDKRKYKKVCDGCRWNINNKLTFTRKMCSAPCDNSYLIGQTGGYDIRCMHYFAIEILSDLNTDYLDRLDDINKESEINNG
jgi:hypothetical protein